MKQIKESRLELLRSVKSKEVDLFDIAFAIDAIGELIERFESIEKRYFAIFGMMKHSEHDELTFQDERRARLMPADDGEH